MSGTQTNNQPIYFEFIGDTSSAVVPRGVTVTLNGTSVPYHTNHAPAVYLAPTPRRRNQLLKRGFDIVGALTLIIVLAPLLLAIAIAIKLTSQGKVIFKQQRVGLNGVEFWFYKFRSMVHNAESIQHTVVHTNHHGSNGVTFKAKADPRITPVGRILRRFSLDELPQLWNVLKGDMSLVGPRPGLPSEVAKYTEHDRLRLTVIPGLTCFWQVQGRANIPFAEQVQLDIKYIKHASIWLDIKLLFLTIKAVFSGRGAY